MMKICLNTDVLMRYPIEEALAMAAGAGYRAINLNAIPFWEPHLDLGADEVDESIAGLRVLLERHRLELAVVEASTNLSAWDDKERARALDYSVRAVNMLGPLGCKVLCLSAPGTNLLGIAEQHAFLERSIRVVSSAAAQQSMQVALEIYPGSCLERTIDAVRLLDDWQIPNLGYTLCVPHVAALGENVLDSYKTARRHLVHVHLADTPSSTVNHKHLVPGDGTVDFRPLFRALAQDGYDGYLTVQIYSCTGDAENAILRARRATLALLEEVGAASE